MPGNMAKRSLGVFPRHSLKEIGAHLSVAPVSVQASYASLGGFLAGVKVLALGFAVLAGVGGQPEARWDPVDWMLGHALFSSRVCAAAHDFRRRAKGGR